MTGDRPLGGQVRPRWNRALHDALAGGRRLPEAHRVGTLRPQEIWKLELEVPRT